MLLQFVETNPTSSLLSGIFAKIEKVRLSGYFKYHNSAEWEKVGRKQEKFRLVIPYSFTIFAGGRIG